MVIAQVNEYPPVSPDVARIPEELKAQPWAVWIAEPRAGQPGKFSKAPRNPRSGIKIGANNPGAFGTFAEAAKALDSGKYSGLGVLLTGDEVGVDIDDYPTTFEQRPDVKAWVSQAVKAGAYCEKSPSGKGLRLFMRGALPDDKGRKVGTLEIYSKDRFLTVTGKRAKGISEAATLIEGQAHIDAFLALMKPQSAPEKAPVAVARPEAGDETTVRELCERMAEKEPLLWAGDWQQRDTIAGTVGYASKSDADMAFCGATTREADSRGVTAAALPEMAWRVYELSGLFIHDENQADRRRKVQNYTIPRAVSDALEGRAKAQGVTATEPGAAFASGEPGDIIAGRVFASLYRGKLLFVTQAGRWLRWDGVRWAWCALGEEMAAAKKAADYVLDSAIKLAKSDADKHKKRLAFALRLQNLPRLEAMVSLAKSEEGMSAGHMTELDSDSWLLGARNGVVNLRDGSLLAPDPAMLITRQAGAEYHRDAQCPKWLAFLDSVFEGDTETIAFIQRALGYTMTGVTTEEALFICYGHGANGKSVFANIIGTVLGDYAQAAPPSLLTVRRDGDAGPRNDIARLCGARLVQINELQQGDRLDEQVVKMLAGREMLSARFLHKEYFDFWPTAKPWLRTNHRPIVTGEDDGIWRRLHLIPFKRKFAEHERDPWLESKLLEERDGILAWMVAGCLDWHRNGLKPSPLIRRESASYRKESDLLGEFLDETTTEGANERTEQGTLYRAWRGWCEVNGVSAGSKKSFTRKLSERGFGEARSNGQRFYTGLAQVKRAP